jgi:4-hydroxybenzoate polyprenyltransferase
LIVLVIASCALYLAGMVLNDVFEAEVDARERPDRPIPSGRIPLAAAAALGWALLATGVLLGWLGSFLAGDWRPGIVATLLAACVVLYDWTLKRTSLAPLLMGACRALNVLLGMSLAAATWTALHWVIAIGIGVYIVGVTIFARTEAGASSRRRLAAGTLVMLAGMAIAASVPMWISDDAPIRLLVRPSGWYLLWAVLALLIARRCVAALLQPDPSRVQAAVRNAVQSIIVLDAAVCAGLAGPIWGFAVLLLIVPTMMLTLWLQAT